MSGEERGMLGKRERFTVGQLVTIKPEWQDPGDESILWVVLEDNGPRLIIEAQLGLTINPQQIVTREMVESVADGSSGPSSEQPENEEKRGVASVDAPKEAAKDKII